MTLRRNFMTGMIASIVGFFGIKKADAEVKNWIAMDTSKDDWSSSNKMVSKDGLVGRNEKKVAPLIMDAQLIDKKQKTRKNVSFPDERDLKSHQIFSNTIKCKIEDDSVVLTQGREKIKICKDDVWKSQFGPLFEVIVPSIYITLNPDNTINNIWTPQNLAIGLAKHDENGELKSVECKVEHNINESVISGTRMGWENRISNGQVQQIYPVIEEDCINVIEERYLPLEEIKKDKSVKATEVLWENSKHAWKLNPSEPAKVKKDGEVYVVIENTVTKKRWLVRDGEQNKFDGMKIVM